MHRSRLGLFASILISGVAGASLAGRAVAKDDPPRLNLSEAKQVASQVLADTQIAAFFKMCPADAYRRKSDLTKIATVPLATCRAHPKDCFTQCRDFNSGENCFQLARALDSGEIEPLAKERLFLMACADGRGAGCVNRSASIRNGDYKDDPFEHSPAADKQACEFRSFKIGCDQEVAWGCAMLGQSYQYGEGTPVRPTAARAAFEKSCRINPTFVACGFAKDHLSEMKRKDKGEGRH